MGRRLETLRTAKDLLLGVRNLASVRRSGEDISLPYVALGTLLGYCHRFVKKNYVGRFRDDPGAYLVFVLMTVAAVLIGNKSLDDSTRRSVFAGLRFGSFAHRALNLRREE